MRKAVFIDRDGVVVKTIKREGFVIPTAPFSCSEMEFFENISCALELLHANDFLLILVTNQPDIAYGYITQGDWEKIHKEVQKLAFDDIFICFHRKNDGCECKKPKPGMLLTAQKKWNIDMTSSFMVGDTDNDTIAGSAAGCRTIIVDAPYNQSVSSDFRVLSLFEAAHLVISENY